MVAYKPFERPSIEQILKSEWMKEINEKNEEEIKEEENKEFNPQSPIPIKLYFKKY